MPRRKIPEDAFSFYFGLGPGRSYRTVAEKYDVTKRAVTKLATKERWQERIGELERKARQSTEEKALESLDQMNERHLKSARVVQMKALETLRAMPLETAIAAVKALDTGMRQERLVRGEPSERTALSLEETIRREYERWMTVEGAEEDDEDERKVAAG